MAILVVSESGAFDLIMEEGTLHLFVVWKRNHNAGHIGMRQNDVISGSSQYPTKPDEHLGVLLARRQRKVR